MIRPVLTELLLFLAPFALYALFLLATRARVLDPAAWTWPTVGWLTIAALLTVTISFVVIAQFAGEPPGSTYVPAHVKDGKLVPGQSR
jgi:hypothetical protein